MEAVPIYRPTIAADVSRSARARSGFTLIELVVVVLIMAVAAALVLPAVRAGGNQRVIRQTLQRFVSVVRRASTLAVLRRENVELWVWPADGRYALVTHARPAKDDETEAERSANPVADQGELEDELGESRHAEAVFELPEIGEFGRVDGGRLVSERMTHGKYARRDAVLFEFHPVGSSSGGTVEFVFDVPPRKQSYALTINPLVSEISMEGGDG
jgi:type II secretion system protein H